MFAGLMALSPFRKLIVAAAGFLIIFGAGFTAAEAFEHRRADNIAIFGWHPLGLSLRAQRDQAIVAAAEWKAASDAWQKNRQGWVDIYGQCKTDRKRLTDDAANAVSKNSDAKAQAADHGFDSGYSAGRVAGLKACGAPNAQAPLSAHPGQPAAGGVRDQAGGPDLATDWGRSAYRPPH